MKHTSARPLEREIGDLKDAIKKSSNPLQTAFKCSQRPYPTMQNEWANPKMNTNTNSLPSMTIFALQDTYPVDILEHCMPYTVTIH